MRLVIIPATLLSFLLSACESISTSEASQARISRARAEAIARREVPDGRVREAELEKENGMLVWSLDLERPGTRNLTELWVDARNGKIVGREIETPEDEAREMREKKARRR